MRHAIIAVLLLAALAGTAVAGPFEDAVSAYDRGNYATALRRFRVLAEQGHAKAQFKLGFMYDYGEGVPQDYAEAVKWYRKAAEQGHGKAQWSLGAMPDHVQAQSSELLDAFNRSAELYAQGRYQEALPFAEEALRLGEDDALFSRLPVPHHRLGRVLRHALARGVHGT